jgi:heat-inducible transcriptional repressor
MLTERRARILGCIVDEYVRSAQPVPSELVASKYGLDVSPATIRSEMMRLEGDEYIVQPHTSAGRLPTDKGYRYYVEYLMAEHELPLSLQGMIRHQFHQATAGELDEWARLAASILARQAANVAVVTAPHPWEPRLRWLDLVQVHELLALLIVILQEARVLRQTLVMPEPVPQEALSQAAGRLSELLAGLTAAEMRQRGHELAPFEEQVVEAVLHLLEEEETAIFGPAFLEGLSSLLEQPEFAQGEHILETLDILNERNLWRAIPFQSISDRGVTIVIGSEHPDDAMRPFSLVVTRYGGPGDQRGVLCAVGPTRLHYSRAVAVVRYLHSIMNELLEGYFG